MDKYARQIDRLPMLNVDGEMLDYGAYVSSRLRDSSMAVKGIGIQSKAKEMQYYGRKTGSYGGYRWGRYGSYYGTYDYNPVEGQRRAIRYAEKAKGATSAIDIMTDIENTTAGIRRSMTEKYRMEF